MYAKAGNNQKIPSIPTQHTGSHWLIAPLRSFKPLERPITRKTQISTILYDICQMKHTILDKLNTNW